MADATASLLLLGGTVTVTLYDVEEALAVPLFHEIHQEGLRLQRIFNLYDPASELSRLNRLRVLQISEELRFVLAHALMYSKLTDGAYDVTKGRVFLARKRGEEIAVSCSFRDVEIEGEYVCLKHPDVLLDLGSIAKGFIGDALLEFIKRLGVESAFIDARGDMKAYGQHLEVVDIQHPRISNMNVGTIVLENMAVATSGDYRQFVGTYDRSHIVGAKDLISVSVVTPSLMEADALATAIFVVGHDKAKALLRTIPGVRALAVDSAQRRIAYNGFEAITLSEVQNGA